MPDPGFIDTMQQIMDCKDLDKLQEIVLHIDSHDPYYWDGTIHKNLFDNQTSYKDVLANLNIESTFGLKELIQRLLIFRKDIFCEGSYTANVAYDIAINHYFPNNQSSYSRQLYEFANSCGNQQVIDRFDAMQGTGAPIGR